MGEKSPYYIYCNIFFVRFDAHRSGHCLRRLVILLSVCRDS